MRRPQGPPVRAFFCIYDFFSLSLSTHLSLYLARRSQLTTPTHVDRDGLGFPFAAISVQADTSYANY